MLGLNQKHPIPGTYMFLKTHFLYFLKLGNETAL